MRKVFHGATRIVDSPLCHIGRDNLDFGKGFYITDIRKQAISWATRVVNIGLPQWLNVYELMKTTSSKMPDAKYLQHTTKNGLTL